MAAYDYRCRECGETFEIRRSVLSDESATACPYGHSDVVRVWSAVAVTGAAGLAGTPAPQGGGGCCGGGCCG